MRLNSFLRFFSRAWKKPISKKRADARCSKLLVELLERRDVMTVPTIVSTGVLPLDGSSASIGHPTIQVQFSTAMDTSTVVASNFVLLGSSGNTITIDNVVQAAPNNGTTFELLYNGGVANPLVVDNYTLFVKGDRLFDVGHVDAMAQPGQLIVANQGRNNVSVMSLPGDGTVGAPSNYNMGFVGTQAPNPRVVASGDLNGDHIKDLVVVNTGINQAHVFLGQTAADGGGYNTAPDLTLTLPGGTTVNLDKSIAIADLNNDGKQDIVITNVIGTTDNVTIFLNTTVAGGAVNFDAGTNTDIDATPSGVVVADFDNDGFVDIAIAVRSAATDLSTPTDSVVDFRINLLVGDGTGAYGAASLRRFRVGDASTGINTPVSIAAARLDNDNLVDLVIGASNGVFTMLNTSSGAANFNFANPTSLFSSAVVAVATGKVNADGVTDIFATTSTTLEVFRNQGGGSPTFARTSIAISAGAAGGLAVGDLDRNGRDDVVIANGTAANSRITVLRNDSDLKSTTLNIQGIAVVAGVGLEVTTTSSHGLSTGDEVYFAGVTGTISGVTINGGTFVITKTANDKFRLNNTSAATGSGTGGTASNRSILAATGAVGTNVVITTATSHGLTTGDRLTISGSSLAAANGVFTITALTATTFSLNGVTGTGTNGTGGEWRAGISGTISSASRSSGTVSITTSAAHGLVAGDIVTISGLSVLGGGNGTFTLLTASGTTLTYSDAGSDGTFTLTNATWNNGVSFVAMPGGTGTYLTGSGSMGVAIISPHVTGRISTVTGAGAAPIVIATPTAHGLTTGASVTLSGIAGYPAANGTFTITVVSATSFSLDGTTAAGAANGTISSASRSSGVVTVQTGAAHNLAIGDSVTISGLTGGNGTFTVTSASGSQFTYDNAGANAASLGTGTWSGTPAAAWTANSMDTNQDNFADVVVANNTDNSFTLYTGAGDGTLNTGVTQSLTPQVTNGLVVADFNNDGKADIATINRTGSNSGGRVTVMQGLSGGKYANPIDFDAKFSGSGTFNNLTSIAVGDIDGDGDLDILFSAGTNEVGFLENRHINTSGTIPNITALTSFVAKQEIGVRDNPLQIAVGDFNRDGKLDMAVAHNGSGGGGGGSSNRKGVEVFLGNGNFGWGSGTNYISSTSITSVVVGDFNRDGFLDFIGGEDAAPGNIHVRYGDGNGGFSNGGTYATTVPNVGALSAADFNGDGYLDIVVGSKSFAVTNAGVAVLINQLGTGFGIPTQTDVAPGTPLQQVLPSDVNQDGFTDIIVTSALPKVSATISSISNQGGIFRVTSNNHGLVDGQKVTITGSNLANLNGTFTVDVPGGGSAQNQFDLTGSTFQSGTYTANSATWVLNGPTINDNVFVMIGNGTGGFEGPTPYLANATSTPFSVAFPSYVGATTSPLIRVTTFTSGGTIVNTNFIANGDFEARDLNVESGNLLGWQTAALATNPGSRGAWLTQTGTQSPLSGTTVPAPSGRYRAMLDQANLDPYVGNTNPNTDASYAGTHALYQDITIPVDATKATLFLNLYIDNTDANVYGDGSSPTVAPNLEFNATADNQQVRIDIVDPTASMFTMGKSGSIASVSHADNLTDIEVTTVDPHGLTNGTLVTLAGVTGYTAAEGAYTITVVDPSKFRLNGTSTKPVLGAPVTGVGTWRSQVLRTIYTTTPTTATTVNQLIQDLDLTAFKGRTIRLRIATTNNRGRLIVGVDNVRFNVQFPDSTGPVINSAVLRNPAFTSGGIPHTNDPTFIGRFSDNSGIAGIAYIEFDANNAGPTGPSYRKLTPGDWDASGQFAITLPNIGAGLNSVVIRVVDKAGNATSVTRQFFMQSNSVTEWEAIGPQGIDVTGQNGIDFQAVSGRITTILADANDPLGNTYFVGSANGGIWKTTNGGKSWDHVTATVYDESGNVIVIPVAVSSIAQSSRRPDPLNPGQSIVDHSVLYASTGIGDQALDSRPGVGVLKSTDGGNTWKLLAGSVADGSGNAVMRDARTVKVVIDPDNLNIVYVGAAVNAGGQGAVYKTSNGGTTWTNVLVPANMSTGSGPLPGGTAIASVTDLIIDPANGSRLFVALGNIGLANGGTAVGTAGVWFSPDDFGQSWLLRTGGGVLPSGTSVGRVTIGMGSGGAGDQRYFYAMVSSVPGNNTPPSVNWGSFTGLYKSSNNLLNFTKVMLKEDANSTAGGPGDTHTFVDINLLGNDAANAGALIVDPNNPNIVYVGGSNRWNAGSSTPNHLLVRIDTGNMAANGDDADKAARGTTQGGYYDAGAPTPSDTYVGEGVYWYDLAEAGSGGNGNRNLLPPAITSLTLDAQGRLLIGTVGGIWRGVPYGFSYDYTSGGQGILRGGGGGGGGGGGSNPFGNYSAPGMTLTSINGNLQISSMTSVAIDPFNRGVYYTTQIDTGVAKSTTPLVWVTQGLTGPTTSGGANLGIPTAGRILTGFPPPDAAADTPVSLYRVWQFANSGALIPETSTDNGTTWNSVGGIPATTAGIFPAFAINPNPVQLSGVWQNQLLFGADQVYFAGTSGFVWDDGFSPVLSAGANISAMAFAPSDSTRIYAATDNGRVFRRDSSVNWPQINGTGGSALPSTNRVNAIAVNPANKDDVFVMLGGTGLTTSYLYRTTNASSANPTWTPITAAMGVPVGPAYALVFDPNPGLGAPNGKIYVATEVGVFFSRDGGATFTRLGEGMPNVPVVDLKLDVDRTLPNGTIQRGLNVLAAATIGRGVYTINTSAFSFVADQTVDEDTPSASIPFTVNDPGLPAGSYTITASSNNQALIPNGSIVLSGTGPNRTIQFTPAADKNSLNATTTSDGLPTGITITLTNGSFVYSQKFLVTVNSVNDAPIVNLPNGTQYEMLKNPALPGMQSFIDIPFTISDVDTTFATFSISATSNDQTVLPDANIVVQGTNGTRNLRITPAPNQHGPVQITLQVNDGGSPIAATTPRTIDLLVALPVTLPFTDDFLRANNTTYLGAGWRQNVGDVDLISNTAQASAAINVVSLNGLNTQNIAVQTDINTNLSQAGLIARYGGTGDTNMYLGSLIKSGSTYRAYIYRNVGGVWTELASGNVSGVGTTAGTGTLRFEVVGTSLKLFYAIPSGPLNLVAFANDSALTTGSAGYRTSSGAVLDNFSAGGITLNDVTTSSYTAGFQTPSNGTQLSRSWLDRVGNFTATSDTVATSNSAGTNLATLNSYSQADVIVQSNVTLNTTMGFNVAGLVARYSGPGDGNMYLGTLLFDGTNTFAQIYRNVGGAYTLLHSASVGNSALPRVLRFEAVGTSLKLFVNNELKAFASDSAITAAGSVGIRSFGGDSFNTFTVNTIALDNISTASYSTSATAGAPGFVNDSAGNPTTPASTPIQLSRSWLERAGSFTATSNTVASANSSTTNLATLNGYSQSNVIVESTVTMSLSAGFNVAGLVARYSGPLDTNLYLGTLLYDGTNTFAQIYRNIGGAYTLLHSASVGNSAGPRVLRFEAVGTSLKLFVDNQLKAYASDSAITAPGSVGIRSFGSDSFNGFSVNTITLDNLSATTTYSTSNTAGAPGFANNLAGNPNSPASTPVQLSRSWVEQVGNFSAPSNDLASSTSTSTNLAVLNGYSRTDVVVQSNVTLSTASGFNVAGLVARYSGQLDANLYLGTLLYDGTNTYARIYRNVGGVYTQLATSGPLAVAATRTLRFEVVGNSLKLFVNNNLAAFANDTAITAAGSVGIRSFGGDSFASFTVNTITLDSLASATTYSTSSTAGTPGFANDLAGNPNSPASTPVQLSRSWVEQVGNFSATSNNLASSTSTSTNLAVLNGYSRTDVVVQSDVTLSTVSGFNVAGLVARYSGQLDANLYLGTLLYDGTNTYARIYRNVGGVYTQLATSGPLAVAATRTLRFEVVGNSLKLFVNNELKAFTNDTAITAAGSVGIRSFGSDSFASFNVNTITLDSLASATTYSTSSTAGTPGFANDLAGNPNSPASTPAQLSRSWVEQVGNFSATSNNLASSTSTSTNLAVLNGYSRTDVVVQSNVTLSTASGFNVAGLVARYSGQLDANLYLGTLLYDGTNTYARIYRNVGGVYTQLATSGPLAVAATRTLRFEVVGTSLKLFVDGNLATFAHDSAITAAGSVGIRSFGGDSFASFTVNTITLSNVAPPYTAGFQTPSNGTQLSRSWFERAGNFAATSDTTATASSAALNLATLYGMSTGNMDIQADITVGSGTSHAGLVARYQGTGDQNMYVGLLMFSGGVTNAQIYRNVGGAWTLLASATVTNSAVARPLRFTANGSLLSLYVDGAVSPTVSVTDNTFATGAAGIRGTAGTAFSNFAVS